jgi:hypothetical protein
VVFAGRKHIKARLLRAERYLNRSLDAFTFGRKPARCGIRRAVADAENANLHDSSI